MWEESSDVSQDSVPSTTASDVLIRSSRVTVPERSRDNATPKPQHGAGRHEGRAGMVHPRLSIARDMETDNPFPGSLPSILHSEVPLSHGFTLHSEAYTSPPHHLGVPIASPGNSGAPISPHNNSGAPISPHNNSGAPISPHNNSGAPISPHNNSGAPISPHNNSGAPISPHNNSGAPISPHNNSGAPISPHNNSGAPISPHNNSGAPISLPHSDVHMIHIPLKKMREVPAPLPDFCHHPSDPVYTPPALQANKYPVTRKVPDTLNVSRQKKSFQKDTLPQKIFVTKHMQDGSREKALMKTNQEGNKWKSRDIQISQFASGQKETVLTTLTKRAQSAPATKAVKVKLLENSKTAGKMTPTLNVKETRRETDCATTIAAATAAAIATSFPMLKFHSDMEAQVNSVTQVLNRLQETDRQLQHLTEQQSKTRTCLLDKPHDDRVKELESQLSRLTEQRLQHLEKLQEQQIAMQTHLISCAAQDCLQRNKSSGPACANVQIEPVKTSPPSTSSKGDTPSITEDTKQATTSPLDTPAPRKFAPVPISVSAPEVQHKTSQAKENMEKCKEPAHTGHVNSLQEDPCGDKASSWRGTSLKYQHPGNDCLIPSTTDPMSFTKSLHGGACPSAESAVQTATEVLHDLGTLRREMRCMMREEAKRWTSQVGGFKPTVESCVPAFSSITENPQPILRKAVPLPKSMCDTAERILKEVQNNKKILEDNLDSIIRAKDGTAMYSLISALTTDSNGAEKIRIQKEVDHWIEEIRSEIQDELIKDTRTKSDHRVCEGTQRKKVGSLKDLNMKGPGKSTTKNLKSLVGSAAKPQSKQSQERLAGKLSKKETYTRALLNQDKRPKESIESTVLNEELLNQMYGKPIYQGHRSTMRKGPYLRFNSPSPKSKAQRPKVIETVRGIKMKSAKVQTSSSGYNTSIVKDKLRDLEAPEEYEPQYVFNPSREAEHVNTPLEGHLIPLAIPLGRTRSGGKAPMPSSVLVGQPPPMVSVSIPPSPPKPPSKTVKPNIAIVEMRSEKRDTPKLTVEVLPCIDIDSIISDSTSMTQSSPGLHVTPTCVSAQPDVQLPAGVESEEEILAFPGVSYVQVTDLVQEDEGDGETMEPVLELDGWAESNPPYYHGIPFPPPVSSPQAPTDILDGIISHKQTLENRLVDWVEQEIMAKVISEMCPIRVEALPDITLSSSESRASETSDIVEAAGGKGLQLFVDAGVPVDSSLIRRLVDEALAEMVAVMLGDGAAHRAPVPPLSEPTYQVAVSLIPTPQDTPPASPPPATRKPSLVKTPDLSPQTSLAETQSHIEHVGPDVDRSPVGTPLITPSASPPRVSTPSVSERTENQADSTIPSLLGPWSRTELPLEEENPHSLREAVQKKDAIVMTVAKDEEQESLVSVPSPEPENLSISLTPPQSPSPLPSPSSEASTQQSSLTITITETESLDRPISEGEIFYSFGQVAAARAFAEEGLTIPNVSGSLSSTLRDANDMEYDPPSEGQVIPRTHRGAHRDPILSALAKLNQDPVASQVVLHHPEGSEDEDSAGEVSDGQRPCLTTAAEQVLMGRSAFMGRTAHAVSQRDCPSSPGLFRGVPGPSHAGSSSSGPMSIRELDSRVPVTPYQESVATDQRRRAQDIILQTRSLSPEEHRPIKTRIIHVDVKASEEQGTQEDLDRTLVEPSLYINSQSSGILVDVPKKVSLTVPSVKDADKEDVKTSHVDSDLWEADHF